MKLRIVLLTVFVAVAIWLWSPSDQILQGLSLTSLLVCIGVAYDLYVKYLESRGKSFEEIENTALGTILCFCALAFLVGLGWGLKNNYGLWSLATGGGGAGVVFLTAMIFGWRGEEVPNETYRIR